MSQPRSSSAYPEAYLRAVQTAYTTGSLVIPTPNPLALRLQFQGLRGALRLEGAADLIDALSFHVLKTPPSLELRLRENCDHARAVTAALNALSPTKTPSPDADEALSRILGQLP